MIQYGSTGQSSSMLTPYREDSSEISNSPLNIQDNGIENLSSEPKALLSQIKDMQSLCKKKRTLMNLCSLRRLIDEYYTSHPWTFISNCCVDPTVTEAEDYYDKVRLFSEDRTNLENLVNSFGFYLISPKVTDFSLPEGIYSGYISEGLPHGEGRFKVKNDKDDADYAVDEMRLVYKYTLIGEFEHGEFKKGKKSYYPLMEEEGIFKEDKLVEGTITNKSTGSCKFKYVNEI